MAAAIEKAASEARERLADMTDGMHEMTDHAAEAAGEGVKQVRDTVRRSARTARRSIARMEKSFEDTVARRPLISVGTAFGLGMGIVFGMWALDCFMNRDR